MIGLKVTAILLDLVIFKLWWSFIDMGCYNFDIFYILPECLHFAGMFTFCKNVYILSKCLHFALWFSCIGEGLLPPWLHPRVWLLNQYQHQN